ncbi:RHS repeat-associated core domain-containing protein [Chryseobacterium wanjuense]|uniref:RHS repeat-associated core domain-containing protein n=1 Tax=Chryseobacterium wanjuense TaxID=356305 RepID=A0A1I0S201_9FLAO|nr:DUF6443 domain-containing protein [Chryseobacterium wanjuense]SEW48638.1 RHS repeat-associated core domain-containing protein [Chryseobacterium wanjuense]
MKKYITEKITTVLSVLLVSNTLIAQASNTENYISEKTCFDADCVKNTETINYFDGLGRSKQTVGVKASPTEKDVVTHFEYDAFGRQIKNYLPVPQSGTQNGAIYTSPLLNASTVYGPEKIYSENVPENSPLDRIKQRIQFGNDWTSHPENYTYGANTVADGVRKFTTSTTWENNATKSTLGTAGNYIANQLSKETVIDEDGYSTIEFTNTNGQLILERREITVGDYVDTYYVYNEYDQLVFIIPSQANIYSDLVTNTTRQADLCYQYKYDGRYRMVEKKLPGKGWEFILYDKQDRVVATQDANLRAQGRWLYTKYDKFGRVAITGIGTGATTRLAEQNIVDGLNSNNVERTGSSVFNREGMDVYYNNQDSTYPNSTKWFKILTLNYYDQYPAYDFNPTFPTSILGEPTLTQNEVSENVSTKSLPVLNLIKNIEDDRWTKKYTYYDKKGRVIGLNTINYLDGYTRLENELDFIGQTKQTKTFHKRSTTDTEVVIKEDFEYDNLKRLKKHWHQVNNGIPELLTDNTYNERSLLSNQKLGNNLQSIDYEYDVRGWLTKINDPANLGGKLFGYKIKYHNPDPLLGIQEAKYNGNISEVDWKTATDGILKRYTYKYDGLNRLIYGKSYQPLSTTLNIDYYEDIEYDNNGNIANLVRGKKGTGNTSITEVIDNLTYNYEGNKLITITDETGNTSGYPGGGNIITYDTSGNMTSMLDKRIKQIDYNFLNLPNSIQMNAAIGVGYTLNHIYRADGVKHQKQYMRGSTFITTDYLDGFQYEHSSLLPTTPDLKFVPTTEGYYSFENNKYIYQYKDQVGNIRVSFYKDTNGNAVIDDAVDFYPFGLEHGTIATSIVTPSYKYSFQGQEKQIHTGWSSFKWRNYDPSIGRFFNVDPLSEKYAYQSHYNFSENRVIDARELEGLEAVDFRKNDGYKNLVVVVQGHSGDTVKGHTQARNRGDGSVDKNGLGALNQLSSKDTRVVIFDSSQNENTKDDINSTISSFNKNHPDGDVTAVGHSLGGDNLIEKTNENKDLKINLMITLDIMDFYSDTTIKSKNVSKVMNYYQTKDFYGGEKVTVSEDNKKTKVTNIHAPKSTHKSIDNDLSKKIVKTVKDEINKPK